MGEQHYSPEHTVEWVVTSECSNSIFIMKNFLALACLAIMFSAALVSALPYPQLPRPEGILFTGDRSPLGVVKFDLINAILKPQSLTLANCVPSGTVPCNNNAIFAAQIVGHSSTLWSNTEKNSEPTL